MQIGLVRQIVRALTDENREYIDISIEVLARESFNHQLLLMEHGIVGSLHNRFVRFQRVSSVFSHLRTVTDLAYRLVREMEQCGLEQINSPHSNAMFDEARATIRSMWLYTDQTTPPQFDELHELPSGERYM